ncbi:hypothetical protein COCCADRAFT_103432, partial [Bipolaris zeicola 26-R-13]
GKDGGPTSLSNQTVYIYPGGGGITLVICNKTHFTSIFFLPIIGTIQKITLKPET